MTHCKGTKAATGEPCRTTLGLSLDGFCIAHDPERRDSMRAARVAGGKAAGEARRSEREVRKAHQKSSLEALGLPAAPRDIDDASRAMALLYAAGASGVLEPERVRECIGALKAFSALSDKRDLSRQLKAYRKAIETVRPCPTCGPAVARLLVEARS